MNRACKSALTVVALTVLLLPVAALAANKKNNDNPKHKVKTPVYSKVTAVDAKTGLITITDPDGTARKFTVDNFTAITVNGEAAALAKVETGMKVTYTVGAGVGKVSRIDAEDPPIDKSKADTKKKK